MKRPYARSSASDLSVPGIPDDHGLAAAVVQARQGVLVGHGPGQVEHVGQGRVLAGVRVEARPAEGRTERRRVDGDDGLQPALPVLAEGDLLVPMVDAGVEGGGEEGTRLSR